MLSFVEVGLLAALFMYLLCGACYGMSCVIWCRIYGESASCGEIVACILMCAFLWPFLGRR
jgi:hypothetical protein